MANLTDILAKPVAKWKTTFSKKPEKMVSYLARYELKDYFQQEVPEGKRHELRESLEEKVGSTLKKYDKELGLSPRKGLSKAAMGLATINDLYAYVSNVPLANVTGLGYALFAIKTVTEIPAMWRYVTKAQTWYGATGDITRHLLLKPLRYLLPVVGPMLESGAFERMVRRRVLKEVKYDFIKEHGNYKNFADKLKQAAKQPVGETIKFPSQAKIPERAAA